MSKPTSTSVQNTNITYNEDTPYKLSDIPRLIEDARELNARMHAFYDELLNRECRSVVRTINAYIKRAVNDMENYTTVEYGLNNILQDNPYCNRRMRLKYIVKVKDYIATTYSEFNPVFTINNNVDDMPVAYNIRLSWEVYTD